MNDELTIWSSIRKLNRRKGIIIISGRGTQRNYTTKGKNESVANSTCRWSHKRILINALPLIWYDKQRTSNQPNTNEAIVPSSLSYELQALRQRICQDPNILPCLSKRKPRRCCENGFVYKLRRMVAKKYIKQRHWINDKRLGVIMRGKLLNVIEIWKSYGAFLAKVQQYENNLVDEMISNKFNLILDKNIVAQVKIGSKLLAIYNKQPFRVEDEMIYMQSTKVDLNNYNY